MPIRAYAQRKGTMGKANGGGPAAGGVTWNPLDKAAGVTLSNGNLTAGPTGGRVRANTSASTGKFYYECEVLTIQAGTNAPGVGVATAALSLASASGLWFPASVGSSAYPGGANAFCNTGSPVALNVPFSVNDVWGVAVDIDTGRLWFSRGGVFCNAGNPAAGTGPNITLNTGLTLFPCTGVSASSSVTARFKQSSWSFAAPAGFLPWAATPALVVQMAHFDGAMGSQLFTNSAPVGATAIAVGPQAALVTLDTAVKLFGTASLRIGATGGQGAAFTASASGVAFGTAPFTIEFSYRPDALSLANIMDFRPNGTVISPLPLFRHTPPGRLQFISGGVVRAQSANGAIAAGAWNRIAYSRDALNVGRLFVGGNIVDTWADNTDYGSAFTLYVPSWTNNTVTADNCNYDEMRLVAGGAWYTTNYTPATSELTP
jgi:hypothetical protein